MTCDIKHADKTLYSTNLVQSDISRMETIRLLQEPPARYYQFPADVRVEGAFIVALHHGENQEDHFNWMGVDIARSADTFPIERLNAYRAYFRPRGNRERLVVDRIVELIRRDPRVRYVEQETHPRPDDDPGDESDESYSGDELGTGSTTRRSRDLDLPWLNKRERARKRMPWFVYMLTTMGRDRIPDNGANGVCGKSLPLWWT